MNEWSDNYDREALVNCCCTYSSKAIIASILGEHTIKETCSGNANEYQVTISEDDQKEDGIIISNFNNSGVSAKASWALSEFRLDNNWNVNQCNISLTGSIHKAGGKLHFIYAALPNGDGCDDITGKTCEARAQ